MAAAHRDDAPCPLQQRIRAAQLPFDVDRLVTVNRIHHRRQVQPLRIGPRKTGVAVRAPLHGRAHAVAVAEVDVVAHADLVAVVQDRGARQGQQHEGDQFDLRAAVVHQRRQPPPDADVDTHARIVGEDLVHVIAFAIGHHFQREFVVVAQENRPLAVVRNGRRLRHDLDDRMAVLHRDGHVHPWHQRKVISHLAFVALAEILAHVLRPQVRFRQQDAARIAAVHPGADLPDHVVGLRQVLVVGAFAFDQIGNRIEPEAVDAHIEPETHDTKNRLEHMRIVEIQVRLMAEKAVPVMRLRRAVPGPVRRFRIGENDARARVFVGIVAPHIVVALGRTLRRAPRRLEPGVLVRGVIDDEFGDDLQAAAVCFAHEMAKVIARSVRGEHVGVVRHVVPVIEHRRWIERLQPDGVDAQFLDVVEFLRQAAKIPDPVLVGIEEGLDVQLIDDRVLVPQRIVAECQRRRGGSKFSKRQQICFHDRAAAGTASISGCDAGFGRACRM